MARTVWLSITGTLFGLLSLVLLQAFPGYWLIAGLGALSLLGAGICQLLLLRAIRTPPAAHPAAALAPASAPALADHPLSAVPPLRDAEAELASLLSPAALALHESRELLPYMRAILDGVAPRTEAATMVLIEKCMAVKQKSAQVAETARQTIDACKDSDDPDCLESVVQRTRAAIAQERQNIAQIIRENQETSAKLLGMGKEIDAGIELLRGIDDITQRSQVIAISLAIEAAHIGEKGKGFQVIAGELHALNTRSVEFAEQVSKLLGRFKSQNQQLSQAISAESLHFSQEVEKGFETSLKAVESLIDTSSRSEHLSRTVSAKTVEIDRDLQGLLESLQFQDITRQMIEGAVKILDDLELQFRHMEPVLLRHAPNSAQERHHRTKRIRQALLDRSKTAEEKTAITGVSS